MERCTKILMFVGALAVWALGGFGVQQAQAQNRVALENITFTSADSIRDFVGLHLGDPDLWPYVLDLNQIASPADLRPGDVLAMPVKQVRAADTALQKALNSIQNATAEGAQVFAPVQIGNAVANRENALERREDYQWEAVIDLSDIASLLAQEALEIAIAQRDRSAEAVVSDVQGEVQGRAPAEPSWSGRNLDDILVEFERVRTLSSSTTQITFRDLSRLRLNANSNATIQRMRSDPLTGDEVTKVSLVNGDFYALLNQLSDKNAFEIDVPGVETKTESGDFWVKNDTSGARFVNYDEAELEITRGGQKVMLGENEGVVLDADGAQTADVLNSPQLSQPPADAILYTGLADLRWDGFEGAAGYWLEVARDPGFNEMQVSEWGISELEFVTSDLPPARYYWRVAALDQLGLPGQWSKPGGFTVRVDNTPPFLTLLAPGDGDLASTDRVDVFGASEPDATVELNGAAVVLAPDGSFELSLPLLPGSNTLTLDATDRAGNTSRIEQTVVYRPAEAVEIRLDEGLPRSGDALATRSDELLVVAATTAQPGMTVVIRGAGGAVALQTVIGTNGALSFSVPVNEVVQAFAIEILSPGGVIEGTADFTAVRDAVPPEITLDLPLPKATDESLIDLTGNIGDAVSLTLDGVPVPLTEGRFAMPLDLTPGVNAFDLAAIDSVGNVTPLRLQTVYDIDPPVITEAEVSRPDGNSGPITIDVRATDPSGLRKSATFVIEVGGMERDGFLRCDNAAGQCTATLPAEPGQLRLIEVAVDDYAGNTAFR